MRKVIVEPARTRIVDDEDLLELRADITKREMRFHGP